MKIRILSALCITSALTGCTILKGPLQHAPSGADATKLKDKQTNTAAASSVETQLLAAAQSIEKSLGTLAAAEKAEDAPILNTAPLMTPEGGMNGLADVDWTGPIAPLVEKIAAMTNYRVKILGNEPPIPILISINAKRTPLAEILQNASLQVGKRAHILVFPASRLIEVRYLS